MWGHSDKDIGVICLRKREIEFMGENGVGLEGSGFNRRDSRAPNMVKI